MKTKLVFQSFGVEYEYRRLIFSIWSFFSHCKNLELFEILVFTDNPDFLRPFLQSLPVRYRYLTHIDLKQMRGEIDFVHRIKIEIIKESIEQQKASSKIIYIDSDTFLTGDLTRYLSKISKKTSFMHLKEYDFRSLNTLPLPAGEIFRNVFNVINSNKLEKADKSHFETTPEMSSWNAGVIMLHQTHIKHLPDVFAITDQIYKKTSCHASEQYAFSLVLQTKTKLAPCNDIIYHYWYRVKKEIIDASLKKMLNERWKALSLNRKTQEVKELTKKFPKILNNHQLILRDNAIQSLNENNFGLGFKYAIRALIKNPICWKFNKDLLYHLKRLLLH